MNTKSYTATENEIMNLYQEYQEFLQESKNPYIRYFFKTDSITISVYKTNKVVIQSKKELEATFEFVEHAGSDESGSGDYFGPLTVCAVIVEESDLQFLSNLNIKDSKQIKDSQIRVIAPKLMERLKHSLLILDNTTYNLENKKYNLNEFKALMHNQAYIHLSKKAQLPKLKVIDQFCDPKVYYRYLKDRDFIKLDFYTKAENKFLAVACASIIARYAFLSEIDKLCKKYNTLLPLGGGSKVDEFGKEFVQQYGEKELEKVAKLHFKNTMKILE